MKAPDMMSKYPRTIKNETPDGDAVMDPLRYDIAALEEQLRAVRHEREALWNTVADLEKERDDLREERDDLAVSWWEMKTERDALAESAISSAEEVTR
jgi:uncharacterized coiled-coil DUF342 family protein